MESIPITIIGAGVVGLAIAQVLSPRAETVVIEQEAGPGKGISSRNSEVIHAGIYFAPSFLKTRLCVAGSHQLYQFCEQYHVPHRRIGKVIVALRPEEEGSLEDLYQRGQHNGVEGLHMLSASELNKREPAVRGLSALLSPATGIIDSHQYTKRLEAMVLASGAKILYHSRLVGLDYSSTGITCTIAHKHGHYQFGTRILINAAGLGAEDVARLAGIDIDQAGYRLYPAKGEYFRVKPAKARLVHGLVYPSPLKDLSGLGIHVTKDLADGLKLGPNVISVEHIDYTVDAGHRDAFFEDTADMLPFLERDDLEPDMAGIRPKLQAPGTPARDFSIQHEHARGLGGLINLVGIESPGLTASLAIGDYVLQLLKEDNLL